MANLSSTALLSHSPRHPFPIQATLEFQAVSLLLKTLGWFPRRFARAIGATFGTLAYGLFGRLRRVGLTNLALAFPEKTSADRSRILRGSFRNLGLHLAEFSQMRRYTPERARTLIEYDGLDNYLKARDRGRGVLVLTGHLGAWELSSFFHSLMGFPMGLLIRRLDNPAVDALVNGVRCLHGNRVIHKDDFARGLISEMRAGQTVGILMDTNMTPPQGVFVPFFGVPACTASGMARVASKTGAAVLPGFLLWERARRRYLLRFGEEIPIVDTGDPERDALTNTARFTEVLEHSIRLYPEQWLWMHRRWKTRPAGDPPIYH